MEVFNEEAQQLTDVRWLAQGTIYPDVIESCSVNGPSATIKSHHNVGGLPEDEPADRRAAASALQDEVRRVGRSLGISEQLIGRHPFPGPGLAIRILGDITPEKVEILQNVDKIYIDAWAGEGGGGGGRVWGRRPPGLQVGRGGGCRAAAGQERRRHGRRAHLRGLRGAARP